MRGNSDLIVDHFDQFGQHTRTLAQHGDKGSVVVHAGDFVRLGEQILKVQST
jgi:hypothetical protein